MIGTKKITRPPNPSVLFITRSYPPAIGGMENFSYNLTTGLAKYTKSKIMKNGYGKKMLPFFVLYALIRAPFTAKEYDLVHMGDPVLAIVGYAIKKLNPHKKIVCNIHGLDLTYQEKNIIYRWYLRIFLSCDQYICISRAAKKLAEHYKLKKSTIISIGIHPDKYISPIPVSKNIIAKHFGIKIQDKFVLLTSGRLVKRKGVAWFTQNVLPKLPPSMAYLIPGDGQQKEKIKKIIALKHLHNRAFLLGRVSAQELRALYSAADLFIMPNIKVRGDTEGFGLVALEASVAGLPVLAAKLEGIQDAVQDNQNGLLLPTQESGTWINKILDISKQADFKENFGRRAQIYTKTHYSWNNILDQYLEAFRQLV